MSGKPLSLFPVRKPSRFSSVPPLSADANQRIVSEMADFKGGVIFSVSVSEPPESIEGGEPADWSAGSVAKAILDDRWNLTNNSTLFRGFSPHNELRPLFLNLDLLDLVSCDCRSTGRNRLGKRAFLGSLDGASTETRDGTLYWVYEYATKVCLHGKWFQTPKSFGSKRIFLVYDKHITCLPLWVISQATVLCLSRLKLEWSYACTVRGEYCSSKTLLEGSQLWIAG